MRNANDRKSGLHQLICFLMFTGDLTGPQDPMVFDCGLSEKGYAQVIHSCVDCVFCWRDQSDEVAEAVKYVRKLPYLEVILVSPLTRTIETCLGIFKERLETVWCNKLDQLVEDEKQNQTDIFLLLLDTSWSMLTCSRASLWKRRLRPSAESTRSRLSKFTIHK